MPAEQSRRLGIERMLREAKRILERIPREEIMRLVRESRRRDELLSEASALLNIIRKSDDPLAVLREDYLLDLTLYEASNAAWK